MATDSGTSKQYSHIFAYTFLGLIGLFVVALTVGWLMPGEPPKVDNDTFFEKFFIAIGLVAAHLAKSPRE